MSIIKNILNNIQASRMAKTNKPKNELALNSGMEKPEAVNKWDKAFLKSLEWKKFEQVSMEYLRIKNCHANVTCIGADGGIDIKISDSTGKTFAVGQCKSWSKPIGVNLIRELFGIMAADGIRHGIFMTTSEYTKEALEFAKGKNLLLIDSDEFVSLVNGLDEINGSSGFPVETTTYSMPEDRNGSLIYSLLTLKPINFEASNVVQQVAHLHVAHRRATR